MKTRVWKRGLAWLRLGVFAASFPFALCADASPNTAHLRITDEASLRRAIARHANIEFAGNAFITFTQPINITSDLTLSARGNKLVISGENVTRLLNVATGATLTLRGLTLVNGRSTNAGAIWNDGTLIVTDCTFSNNIARGADGTNGIDGPLSEGQTHDGTPGQDARGGAIVNNGTLFVTNSSFIANAAIAGAGGNGGVGAFVTNYLGGGGGGGAQGGNASGGAICNFGFFTAEGTRFTTNTALGGAGGNSGTGAVTNTPTRPSLTVREVPGASGVGGDGRGGAIVALGSYRFTNCVFETDVAVGGRGGNGSDGRATTFPGLAGYKGGPGQAGSDGGIAEGGAVFTTATGQFLKVTFKNCAARGGDGGQGGSGGFAYNGGSGGDGGSGGTARGGTIFSTATVSVAASSLDEGLARAGDGGVGGNGGSGGATSSAAGQSGTGGVGGNGGNAEGGAFVCAGARIFDVMLFSNTTIAGAGGTGGAGGSPAGGYWSIGGNGGTGGSGGVSCAGAVYLQNEPSEIIRSSFQQNFSRSGNGGAAGTAASGNSSYDPSRSPSGGLGATGGDAGAAFGGAIAATAELALSSAQFISNRVESGDAGSGSNGGSGAYGGNGGLAGLSSSASGGAIQSDSTFAGSDCVFVANSAVGGLGGSGGSAGQTRSLFGALYRFGQAGGDGSPAYGGAVRFLSNHAEIVHSIFTDNFVLAGDGGNAGQHAATYNDYGASPQGGSGGGSRGGAIEMVGGILTLLNSSVSRNIASSGSGGMTAPASYARFRGAMALPGSPGGTAAGAGISILSGNAAMSGCTFDHNILKGGAGGTGGSRLWINVDGGAGGVGGFAFGGGLFASDTFLSITNSTFYSNSVAGGLGGIGGANNGGAMGGIGGNALGGAIHSVTGTVVMVNASFAENVSVAGLGGSGGVGETNTIGPRGASGGAFGGTLANDSAQFSIVNSLFKHHDAGTNAFGEFIDLGHNISSDASFAFTQSSSFNGYDPLIGPLADNGGPTRTLALLSGSPAIDAGSDEACPPTDQRGVLRLFGAHCDIGAFELNERTLSISGNATNHSTPRIELGGAPEQGHLWMRIVGAPNSDYWLESSTDLLHWFAMTSLRADMNGCVEVRDVVSTNEPMKFFRVRR